MTRQRDPALVRVEGAVIVITTDCCHNQMPLPRQQINPAEPRPLLCFWCGRRRQLQLVTDPTSGIRAVWSNPPKTRRRR